MLLSRMEKDMVPLERLWSDISHFVLICIDRLVHNEHSSLLFKYLSVYNVHSI